MKKVISLALAALLTSVFCFQSNAWSESSLLMLISAILAKPRGGTTTVNDNVTVIDESGSAQIVGSNTSAAGDTELQLSGDLASSTQDGSILYLLPGADDRFPFGIAGKVVSATSNADGTKTVVLGEATYADIVKEASFNMDNIVLDASNFVGVIAPAAVESASPMSAALAKSVADGSVYSFRDGAVVVRRDANKNGAMSLAAEGGTIDAGTVSLNMKVDLAKMGVDASRMSPIDAQTSVGFVIKGALSKIKITNEHDFSLVRGGLKSLNMRVDGDLDFDVKFNGNGTVKLGYFSQAWNEVKDESVKVLGTSAKLTGLSVDDKIGKFPLAGLVWSVPCPKTCPVITGKTQTPLRQAKALGVIVWLYLTTEGEFSLDGNFTLAHLTPAGLSVGIKKTPGSDFQLINSLTKKSSSECLVETPQLEGKAGLQVQAGITTDLDFLAGGVRIANAGMDIGGLFKAEATGEAGYCINNLGSPGEWDGEICFAGGLGGGIIGRAAAKVGIEIDTAWKDVSLDLEYSKQIPNEEDIDKEGRHGLWYYKNILDTCEVQTVISTTGRIWMDRNLGATRAATSSWDELAYGDLYQWGRLTDGHEKRTSGTTTTISSTDVPGHNKFILTSEVYDPDPNDWRNPQNDNLWQGMNGVNNPCPSGFRLPTADEWQAEINAMSENDDSWADSPLKLIGALGYRSPYTGDVENGAYGLFGGYWSSTFGSTTDGGYDTNAQALIIYESGMEIGAGVDDLPRAFGFSVRCIKD